jgi:hypothetical protein
MLEPLNKWICDQCGGVIDSPRDGYLQWLTEGGDRMLDSEHGFKIVHADPKCHFYGQDSREVT